MRIEVKDPKTSKMLELEANPAENNKEPGWTVILPAGDSIFITLTEGEWQVRNNDKIEANFVNAIGEAINPSSRKKEQSWNNPRDPEGASDERDTEKLLRQKKEADIRKDNFEGNSEPKS